MKIIAVMTQKGGVGKTMTASSLAYILGVEHGKRVLIADADQQGNISMLYGRFEPQGIGMSELLEKHRAIGGTYSTEQLIDETPYQNISIIPANGFLMRTNMTLLLLEQDNQILRFKMAMEEIQDRYDYCIVDCGLLMDMTVTNVLVAADLVILPVKVGGFEIEAMESIEPSARKRVFRVRGGNVSDSDTCRRTRGDGADHRCELIQNEEHQRSA